MTALIIIASIIAGICLSVIIGGIICNKSLVLTRLEINSEDIPKSFDGYRIAHISDLHNASFGKGNRRLLALVSNAKPNMIAITGDIVDSRHTRLDVATDFAQKVARIAPTYFVTGNHESRFEEADNILKTLESFDIRVLRNRATTLKQQGDEILLAGAEDPTFAHSENFPYDNDAIVSSALDDLLPKDKTHYTILLCHRPELFEVYKNKGINLALTGHAHGGQIRLPFFGGLFAPKQGFLPEYVSDLTQQDNTSMVVSRGLGNSLFPLRLFNTPEVVLITLKTKTDN